MLTSEQFFCLYSFLFLHLLEIQNSQRRNFVNRIKPVIGHFCDDVVCEDQSLEFFTVRQFVKFRKFRNLVVHEEEIDEIGEGVGEVRELFDAVVGEDEGGEFIEEGEVIKFSDFVVAEIDAFEEVEGGSHVFDEREFVTAEIELTLVEGVGELMGVLDEFGSDFHVYYKGTGLCLLVV